MTYFHLCSTHLRPGSVVQPGNWGRIIRQVGPAHNRWLAEAAMEHVRLMEYSSLPSRMSSSFFFDNEVEALLYQQKNAPVLMLYEVELDNGDAAVHRADYRRNTPDGEFSLDWCRAYWRGEFLPLGANGETCTEILAETAMHILRTV